MFNKLKDTNTKQSERKKIIGELNNNYKDLIGYQISEKAGIDDLTKSYDAIIEVLYKKYQTQAVEKELTELFATRIKHQKELNRLEAGGIDNIEKFNELTKLREEATRNGDAVLAMSYQMQINGLSDVANKTKAVSDIEKVHKTAIEDTDKKIKGITSSFKDFIFEIKEDTKEKEKNIKVTKTLGDANEEALLKYRLLVKQIGEEFVSLADLQKEVKPITFAGEEEEDTSTASLQAMLSAAYSLQQDHYAKLKFLRETNKISQEEYEDELLKMKLDSLNKYLSAATEGLNSLQSISNSIYEKEMNEFKARQEETTKSLEEEYERRILMAGSNANEKKRIDTWYAEQKSNTDKKMAREEEELMREQKKKMQNYAIAQSLINGAEGITKIWATWGDYPPVAIALSLISAAAVALEIDTISSQKFAQGGQGKIEGKYHSEGGVPFFAGEAEKDERWAIFNRQATARNTGLPELIDAINDHEIVIDKNFLTRISGKDGNNNVVVISNFKGGEHLAGMHELMKRNASGDILMPDGRIKKGIIKRRMN
jgi:hypothetical protein